MLVDMMGAQGTRWDVGFELIRWGNDAVPHIVDLIGLSTKDTSDHEMNTIGEDMIRAISSIGASSLSRSIRGWWRRCGSRWKVQIRRRAFARLITANF